MKRGLVLFAHGSRDPKWAAPLHDLARRLATRDAHTEVRVAFLELQRPTLADAIDELGAACSRIDVLPVFWNSTGHVASDLLPLIARARAARGSLDIRVLPTLSELPGLLDFVAERSLALTRTA